MKKIYLLLLVCCFLGCSSQYRKEEAVEKELRFECLPSSPFLGLPIQIVALDSVLLVNDFYGDTLVHCLSLETGSEIAKWGIKGVGPNEVMPPLHLLKGQDSLFVFSRPVWKLYAVEGREGHLRETAQLLADVSLLFPLSDSTYLASGMFGDKRFSVMNGAGKEKMRFGDYPDLWSRERDLPMEIKRMFHQVLGYGFSEKHGFAVVDSHVLSLYGEESGGYRLKKEVLLAPYEYDFSGEGISTRTRLKDSFAKGAVDLAASDSCLYILFDNHSLASGKEMRKEIRCYDWEGNLLCKYIPNVNLSYLTLSMDGKLVGLTEGENPVIAVASLSGY